MLPTALPNVNDVPRMYIEVSNRSSKLKFELPVRFNDEYLSEPMLCVYKQHIWIVDELHIYMGSTLVTIDPLTINHSAGFCRILVADRCLRAPPYEPPLRTLTCELL